MLYILGSVGVVLVCTLFVFVFKVKGSSSTTVVSGCIPYNVEISKSESDYEVVVEWFTKDKCVGYIVYGDEMDGLDGMAIDDDELSAKKHKVVLDGLLSSRVYYFVINSGGTNYGNSGIPLSFSLSSL